MNRIGKVDNENNIKQMMHLRITEFQKEKSITNYAIYKNLHLNSGNANAFLKHGDVSKLSLATVRRILEYVNQYMKPKDAA